MRLEIHFLVMHLRRGTEKSSLEFRTSPSKCSAVHPKTQHVTIWSAVFTNLRGWLLCSSGKWVGLSLGVLSANHLLFRQGRGKCDNGGGSCFSLFFCSSRIYAFSKPQGGEGRGAAARWSSCESCAVVAAWGRRGMVSRLGTICNWTPQHKILSYLRAKICPSLNHAQSCRKRVGKGLENRFFWHCANCPQKEADDTFSEPRPPLFLHNWNHPVSKRSVRSQVRRKRSCQSKCKWSARVQCVHPAEQGRLTDRGVPARACAIALALENKKKSEDGWKNDLPWWNHTLWRGIMPPF